MHASAYLLTQQYIFSVYTFRDEEEASDDAQVASCNLPSYQFEIYSFHFIKIIVIFFYFFSMKKLLRVYMCPNKRLTASELICQIVVCYKSNQSVIYNVPKNSTFSIFLLNVILDLNLSLNQIFLSLTINFKRFYIYIYRFMSIVLFSL